MRHFTLPTKPYRQGEPRNPTEAAIAQRVEGYCFDWTPQSERCPAHGGTVPRLPVEDSE